MTQEAVIITGASSGLGAEFARQFAPISKCLVLTARRQDRLEALARELSTIHPGLRIEVLAGDLLDFHFRQTLFDAVTSRGLNPSVLVNNAGFGTVGEFRKQQRERQLEMIELNCKAAVDLTALFLPLLLQHPKSGLINICSTAAFQPVTYMATYAATKAFLLSFTVALSAELASANFRCLALCPGPTSTEFHIAAGLQQKIDVLASMSSETVVSQAISAFECGQLIRVNGALNRLLSFAPRVFPMRFAAAVSRRMLRRYVVA